MPNPSFKSFLGVAKDTQDVYLVTAIAASATAITVSASVAASTTVFFIDGASSESKNVTAGGGTTSLTIGATTFAHSANCLIYTQLTASLGPVDYIPVTALDPPDDFKVLLDQGVRGSNVTTYNMVQGIGQSLLAIGGDVIPDTFGYLLGSIFGCNDFAGGTPNVFTFASNNAGTGQPTPLLWYVYDAFNTRVFSGAKCSDLTLTYDPAMLLKWTAKFTGNPSGVVATPTSSYSAITVQAAWQVSATIAGVAALNLLNASVTFKRATMDAIPTLQGVQSPYKIWSGGLECTGTLNLVMEDDTNLLQYLNNTQPAVVLTFTQGTGATQVAVIVQMTKCNFVSGWKPKLTGKGYVEVGGPFTAVSNTTDKNTAGAGYSPAQVVLKNAKGTGTYQ